MHTVDYLGGTDLRRPRIDFRLPNSEYRWQLEQAARAHNTSVGEYVRSLVLDALRKEQDQKEIEEASTFFG